MEIRTLHESFLIIKDRINNIANLNKDQPMENKRIFDSIDEVLDELKTKFPQKNY